MYMGGVAISAFYYAITNPMDVVRELRSNKYFSPTLRQDETTPLHELGIGFAGLVIAAVVGAFLGYHSYLISYVMFHFITAVA